MKKTGWLERQFNFGLPTGMFSFYLERLSGTLLRMGKKVFGRPEAILFNKPNGKWSVKESIAHLAEVDKIASVKLQMTPVDLAWLDVEHDDHHLVRVNEILSSLK